tara:strand:- start:5760 stop:6794 length:1035 start_codon:yes stop_codon:yes gene_type:complete
MQFRLFLVSMLILLAPQPLPLYAHGSVTAEDDLCIIRIGFYRAHFKIFQPGSSGQTEFCEDIPNTGESIFVMEYLHQELGNVPVEFRIIHDVTGLGRFARLEDVRQIDDIDAATVFYQGPAVESDVFTVLHEFEENGDYLGIVTARHPDRDEYYQAVFPFKVGFTGFGILPLFLILLIATQLAYWFTSGGYSRRKKNAKSKTFDHSIQAPVAGKIMQVLLLLPLAALLLGASAPADERWTSDGGSYQVSYNTELSPLVINDIHQWTVHVETTTGNPVTDARLLVSGGMPTHDHGLPTSPRVTENLGNGDYLVEGMRFHMMGDWEITIEIHQGERSETVVIPLTL